MSTTPYINAAEVDLKPKKHHGYAVLLFIVGTLLPPLGMCSVCLGSRAHRPSRRRAFRHWKGLLDQHGVDTMWLYSRCVRCPVCRRMQTDGSQAMDTTFTFRLDRADIPRHSLLTAATEYKKQQDACQDAEMGSKVRSCRHF